MTKARRRALEESKAGFRRAYGEAYDRLTALLFEADPAGINFETNTDEYEPEAETILPRLGECHGPGEVQRLVHEEMTRWFGGATAGPIERFEGLAERVWL